MHETQIHQSKHDQILGTSPILKSHSLCVSKGEIPKGKQYAKINWYIQWKGWSGTSSGEWRRRILPTFKSDGEDLREKLLKLDWIILELRSDDGPCT